MALQNRMPIPIETGKQIEMGKQNSPSDSFFVCLTAHMTDMIPVDACGFPLSHHVKEARTEDMLELEPTSSATVPREERPGHASCGCLGRGSSACR